MKPLEVNMGIGQGTRTNLARATEQERIHVEGEQCGQQNIDGEKDGQRDEKVS